MLTYRSATLSSLLVDAASASPLSRIRFVADTETSTVTYPALLDDAYSILSGLNRLGTRPVDRVVLLLERPQDFIRSLWGCVLGGYVPCPVTPARADLAQFLGHVNQMLGCSLLVTTRDLRRDLPPIPDLPVACLEDLLTAPARNSMFEPTRDDLALLMLTSGSTGGSKAVMLTHGNLLASMAAKAERLAVTADDVAMNWIAFDHIAAVEAHLLAMRVGAAQVQVQPQVLLNDPVRFLKLVDANRVTVTFTPNFLFGRLNKETPDRALDLSSVRHIISGGEATVCATARTFLDRLAPLGLSREVITPAFGMTETCAGSVFSLDFPDVDDGEEFASLGRPVEGLDMRVTDDDDVPLPAGETGELQLRGPMVFRGYFNNRAATEAAFTADGWFRTGDRGTIRDGRLTLTGRSKDSIIVNGVNYFSHDLETALEQLDGLEKSYVVAFPTRAPGEDTEQLVVAFSPSGAPDEDALYRLVVAVRNSVVLHWGFRPALILPLAKADLPKTSLGKIQRSRVRRRLEAGELDPVVRSMAELSRRQLGAYTAPEDDVERTLTEIYAEMFDLAPELVGTSTSFFDLGGTSLDVLRLKHLVERRLGMPDLPVVRFLRAATIREQARWLRDLAEGGNRPAEDYDPLVTLQRSGDGTPLFCVHPGVGEVLVFVNLAKYFVNERPFHTLRARGFGAGEPYFASFDEMVQCYVRAIRAEQPAGPYAVAGYSYGGAVAFEIAKVLEAMGERVDFVGIFNLPPHIQDRMHELDPTEGAVNLASFLSLISREEAEQLPTKLRESVPGKRERLEYILGIASKERLAELDLDLDGFEAWVDLAQSLVELGRDYTPSGNVRSLSIFYAIPLRGTKEDWLRTQLRQWDGFSREPNTYLDVPGEHYTLMGATHVRTFQSILRAELDRALNGRDR